MGENSGGVTTPLSDGTSQGPLHAEVVPMTLATGLFGSLDPFFMDARLCKPQNCAASPTSWYFVPAGETYFIGAEWKDSGETEQGN